MSKRQQLARDAAQKAMKTRIKYELGLADALCPYDLAEKMGVSVRFFDVPSMEGMYCKDKQAIIISSLRPKGRQVFTCAHELGHHIYGHGNMPDEVQAQSVHKGRFDEKEYLADCFAGFLLMPKLAVNHAFSKREWDTEKPHISQIYSISNWFGVGYETLINHMSYSLKLLSHSYAEKLLKHRPKAIRTRIFPDSASTDLICVDEHWSNRAIDIQVNEYILLPPNVIAEGSNITLIEKSNERTIYKGIKPGIGRFYTEYSEWSSFVRISK
ncbi:MAG: ImmA/IrrE family metallo-endopeptidase, partial [Chloroflexota bacterium]